MKFKDIVKKLGKTTLYVSLSSEVIESLKIQKGDALEIDVIKLEGGKPQWVISLMIRC